MITSPCLELRYILIPRNDPISKTVGLLHQIYIFIQSFSLQSNTKQLKILRNWTNSEIIFIKFTQNHVFYGPYQNCLNNVILTSTDNISFEGKYRFKKNNFLFISITFLARVVI